MEDPVPNAGKGDPRSLTSLALNLPAIAIAHKLHPASFAPPAIDLAGQRYPDRPAFAQMRNMVEERTILKALLTARNVIGMDDETDETIVRQDRFDLLFPELDRT